MYIESLLGYRIFTADDVCSKLVRVKTHKKKRIDKKWRKRYGYTRIPTNQIYVTNDGMIIAHSKTIERIKLTCQKIKED